VVGLGVGVFRRWADWWRNHSASVTLVTMRRQILLDGTCCWSADSDFGRSSCCSKCDSATRFWQFGSRFLAFWAGNPDLLVGWGPTQRFGLTYIALLLKRAICGMVWVRRGLFVLPDSWTSGGLAFFGVLPALPQSWKGF